MTERVNISQISQYIEKVDICFDDTIWYIDIESDISIFWFSMYRVITNSYRIERLLSVLSVDETLGDWKLNLLTILLAHRTLRAITFEFTFFIYSDFTHFVVKGAYTPCLKKTVPVLFFE